MTDISKATVPTLGLDENNVEIEINVDKLVQTKLFIQASSGGGKSYAFRRIIEQTYGKIIQIIFDIEGEFKSITEKYPMLYCSAADESDVQIKFFNGEKLAKLVMTNKISTIIDISEFSNEERGLFVASFIKTIMNQPPDLWVHALVFFDEAHVLCPQQDKNPAKKMVMELAARGRKRGLCPILATQRISKLNKNVVSELQNRMIGMTNLDTDIKRAADEIGMSASEANNILPDLKPGEFLCFGPAFSNRMKRVKVGKVDTKHGFMTSEIVAPTPLTDDIKKDINNEILKISSVPDLDSEISKLQEFITDKEEFDDIVENAMQPIIDRQRIHDLILELNKSGHEFSTNESDINIAIERFNLIFDEEVSPSQLPSKASYYRWKKFYNDAENQFKCGLLGLIPSNHKKGNRIKIVDQKTSEIVEKIIKEGKSQNIESMYAQVIEQCKHSNLKAPSIKYVRQSVKTLITSEQG